MQNHGHSYLCGVFYIPSDGYDGGYEQYTEEMKLYLEKVMAKTGLMFDTTYSGKGFGGMMQEIEKHHLHNKNIVFWHTGGLMNIMKK